MRDERRPAFRLAAGPRRVERDLDSELEFHLAMRVKRLVAQGVDEAAAREQAMQLFGDLAAVRSECLTIDRERDRAMRRAIRLDDLRQDAAYAARSLAQRKGFTAVLLAILALGIGANAAMFTLVDALLLRALPVAHPEQLVTVGAPWRTGSLSNGSPRADLFSVPLFADVRDAVQGRAVSGLYATGRSSRLDVLISRDSTGAVRAGAEPEHPRARYVSANFFSVLGVPAFLGRTFTAEEDRTPGGAPVVVISHGYWTRRFGADRAAVGSSITVNGTPLTIVGVAPPGFTGDVVGQAMDVWIPLMMQPALMPNSPWLEDRGTSWLLLMGRRAPNVTLEQARVAIAAATARSLRTHATGNDVAAVERQLKDEGVMVEAGARGFSYYRKTYAAALYILSAAVALVLLVICANVANLLLARATARGREMSVRMAIGAGRLRLLQQLLVESLVLAMAGGALGALVAVWGSGALLRLASPGASPIPLDARVDVRVLAFTAGLAVLTALVFGLAPSLHATRVQLAAALRTQGRGLTGTARGTGRIPLGRLLVVAQVALSTLLLVATGMLVRSTQKLERADIGVARDRLLVARVDAQRAGYEGPRLGALLADLTERARRVPGVHDVTYSENGIFSGTESGTTLQIEAFRARADSDTLVAYDDVGPGYFRATGAHLLRGRDVETRDDGTGARVAIVNETMARYYFPHADAIGRHVTMDSASYEIVGIVRDVQEQGVREPPGRRLYVPMLQMQRLPGQVYFQVRTEGEPRRLVDAVRRALRAADPAVAVLSVDAVDDLVKDSIGQDRLVSHVVSLFGGLALVLAALGLYGVIAFSTMRRTNEFGLRMALGADGRRVTRLVLGEAGRLLAAGVAIGIPAALLATSLLRDQLFQVNRFDLPSIALAVGVLAASALAAASLPAIRAARTAPLEALRAD
ncbi:permease (plasmid) [Gemmatirosa kalamazoonensis]|uniref:Permease n=1 Tax=Gemmatirosa kalamazoonensis TaxID=861299 RepID=W0RT72_9BACT|nr:ABC transporter permease [Gemmatirosa kalamazoonensis]AHG93891.1 permease [Gemmatirosa kalamazoonensis]